MPSTLNSETLSLLHAPCKSVSTIYSLLSEELYSQKPNALVLPFMTIGGTDSQFFQSKGVDCYGIIPVLVTEDDIQTMHGIDERISIENFMLGNKIVYNTVKRVCSKR